jgi:hypothetical protein
VSFIENSFYFDPLFLAQLDVSDARFSSPVYSIYRFVYRKICILELKLNNFFLYRRKQKQSTTTSSCTSIRDNSRNYGYRSQNIFLLCHPHLFYHIPSHPPPLFLFAAVDQEKDEQLSIVQGPSTKKFICCC